MNWDQQALESWLEESAKRDEDAMILEKYAKVDEGKIKVNLSKSFFQNCMNITKKNFLQFYTIMLIVFFSRSSH